MLTTDKLFAGSIPEIYDRLLVPLIFESYASDLAERCAGFIANDDLHFVDCRGSFSLYETMEHFPTERSTRQEMEARSATLGSDASHAGTRGSRNLQRPDASMRLPRGFGQTGNLPGVDRHIAQFALSLFRSFSLLLLSTRGGSHAREPPF